MSEAARLAFALGAAAALSFALTPVARRVAIKTSFYDHPTAYKVHARPTPYLGGIAVTVAFLTAAIVPGEVFDGWLTLITCVVLLCLVGSLDDRTSLPIGVRLAVQVGSAVALWTAGLGWELFASDAVNVAVTVFWVVGVVNAFNLMDNQDGAAASVAAACGVGVAALSLIHGDAIVASIALALAGACVGFLPHNLAKPSRIFLGDGGSMAVGVAVAGLVMAAPWGSAQWSDLLVAAPLAGLPIFDTTLVVVSRYRRRVQILSGARDHLTHRLLATLKTPARVAAALACAQLSLGLLALMLAELDPDEVALVSAFYLGAGAILIALLDDQRWLPGAAAGRAQAAEEMAA